MFKKFLLNMIIVISLIIINGCAADNKDSDNKTNVLVSFVPVYGIVQPLLFGLENVEIEVLVSSSQVDPHHFNLSPGDLTRLGKADVVIRHGLHIDEYLNKKTIRNAGLKENIPFLTLSNSLTANDLDERFNTNRPFKESDREWIAMNPHLWVNPVYGRKMAEYMAEEFKKIIPGSSAKIDSNLTTFISELDPIIKDYADLAENYQPRVLIHHNSIHWLAWQFGFEIVDVIEEGHGMEPSPRKIEKLLAKFEKDKPDAILIEPGNSNKTVKMIAERMEMELSEFDPLGRGKAVENIYILTHRKNIETFRQIFNEGQ